MENGKDGAQLRDEGMATALAHAEREAPAWGRAAMALLEAFCVVRGQLPFMNEDLRAYAYGRGLPVPPDERSWGGVMRAAVKRSVVRYLGTRPVKTASGHRGPRGLWIAGNALEGESPESQRERALRAEIAALRERIRVERSNHVGTLTLLRIQKRVNRVLRRQRDRALEQRITHIGAEKDAEGNIVKHVASPSCWCGPTLVSRDPLTGTGVWVHKEKQDGH